VPGARLIEAERPASAINHVIDGAFSAKRVDGRELLDAAKLYEVEVAGAKGDPSPAASAPAANASADTGQAATGEQGNQPDPDFKPGTGLNEEDEE